MGLGRWLNRQVVRVDGVVKDADRDVFAAFDGDTFQMNPGVKIADGNAITAFFRTTYTWNIPAIAAINLGSINSIVTQDVAMSGASVGDFVVAAPVASINSLVGYDAACYSASNIKLRAWYTGSITLTPGNVPFKIVCIKL